MPPSPFAIAVAAIALGAAADASEDIALLNLVPGTEFQLRERAFQAIAETKDPRYLVPLLDLLRHAETAEEWYLVLDTLTPLVGENTREITRPWRTLWDRRLRATHKPPPPEGYRRFRTELLAGTVDETFRELLNPALPSLIPFDAIQWGGVEVGGIPALQDPAIVPADEAGFLGDDERVFGITIDGEARAYPGRILDWHEMANDVLADVPLALTWCTLCGAPIAYRADRGPGGTRLRFGSSGLLYRSNKLMFDASTKTLWNQLTGRPVLGRRVASGDTDALQRIQVRTTTWGAWRRDHPETTVLSQATGHVREYEPGAAYGNYFRSQETMFPVPRWGEEGFQPKELVVIAYGPSGQPWAAPAGSLRTEGILQRGPRQGKSDDAVTFVYLGDSEKKDSGRATRRPRPSGGYPILDVLSFASGDRRFTRRGQHLLEDQDGSPWRVTHKGLIGPGGEVLAAVNNHTAFGFAWAAQLAPPAPGVSGASTGETKGKADEPSRASAPEGDRSPK